MNSKHKVNNYGLKAPNWESAIRALGQVIGTKEAHALWSDVCANFAIDEKTERTSDLTTIMQTISLKEGAAAVVARSLLIRMKTYQLLMENMPIDSETEERAVPSHANA